MKIVKLIFKDATLRPCTARVRNRIDAAFGLIQSESMRMTILATVLTIAALSSAPAAQTPAAPTAAPQDAAKDLAPYQGTWVLTTVNDQALASAGVEMALVVDGTKYSQVVNGVVNETGTVKIDTTKKPVTFDLSIVTGDDAGKLQLGIVEVTGDTMKGVLAVAGVNSRPADFMASDAGVWFIATRKK